MYALTGLSLSLKEAGLASEGGWIKILTTLWSHSQPVNELSQKEKKLYADFCSVPSVTRTKKNFLHQTKLVLPAAKSQCCCK